MSDFDLKKRPWYEYVEHDVLELIEESLHLQKSVSSWNDKFHDYSFVVFPAAKAYEGFLKKLFLDLGLISKQEYYYKYFRIGKALNPELEKRFRKKESVYDKLVSFCGGEQLANVLWNTWKDCRNKSFHWFPDEKIILNFEEASLAVAQILESMDKAFVQCKLDSQ